MIQLLLNLYYNLLEIFISTNKITINIFKKILPKKFKEISFIFNNKRIELQKSFDESIKLFLQIIFYTILRIKIFLR